MTRPTFIIAGEAKAGTTALYSYLTQHPEVFMCEPKEPRYFAFRNRRPDFSGPMDEEWFNRTTVYKRDDYYKLFENSDEKSVLGEASPIYMHIPDCAATIAEELPQVKIIILLRQPIDLAFSAYQHMVRYGHETLSFENALNIESERVKHNWAWHWRYTQIGFVADNIEEYLQHFPREQILFINYNEFQRDNHVVLRQVYQFLDISATHPFKKTLANVNARPRLVWLRNLVMTRNHWLKSFLRPLIPLELRRVLTRSATKMNMRKVREEMAQTTREMLLALYADDIRKCQALTGMDLNSWLDSTREKKHGQ